MVNITTIDENSITGIESSTLESHHPQGSQDVSRTVFEKKIKEREEIYTQYAKRFEKVLELYKKEMDNDNFIKNFDTLVGPFMKAIGECEEALQARKQQGTQRSSNKKLAFWLR
ncbi:12118_t:CDS:1 [Cetraspora pellucida]|uniref:12118_t:CDS:1 n=1 Tax=Cetraspora pellucida TaxID=1433469 RepID=A0ACA9KVK9_9GLOM|nr:12118_t:CDS:1 [Cetraspora pellucida]